MWTDHIITTYRKFTYVLFAPSTYHNIQDNRNTPKNTLINHNTIHSPMIKTKILKAIFRSIYPINIHNNTNKIPIALFFIFYNFITIRITMSWRIPMYQYYYHTIESLYDY